jgi:phosphopantothenoylcysteine decarboxylase/phosphopantothenate--cysteine ligase
MVDFFDPESGQWNSHVDLGIWADGMIIAPATANTMAKMAHGIADNLLLTTYLSARCPVFVAPAMDLDMFKHPATVKNIRTLKEYGNIIIEPAAGELASGLEGKGRMEEPETIVETVEGFFMERMDLPFKNKKILVSAGPTFEPVDPVRFIGNHSSGLMGYQIAEMAASLGASVDLVSGPVNLKVHHKSINLICVQTAAEMYEAVREKFDNADVTILSAAVADFTPVDVMDKKIKEKSKHLKIELKPTIDIAESLGKIKRNDQLLVGFALETHNEIQNAAGKLKKKKLDFIVLNSLSDPGAGFQTETNQVTFIDKDNNIDKFELKSKKEVALDILEKIQSLI